MTIGERIKLRRKELGLTQEELALRLGNKSRASVCTVEKDKEDLTTTRIRQYAEALETTPAYLMGWENSETNSIDYNRVFDELIKKYGKKDFERAISFARAFLSATPEQQKIALDILTLHQDGS